MTAIIGAAVEKNTKITTDLLLLLKDTVSHLETVTKGHQAYLFPDELDIPPAGDPTTRRYYRGLLLWRIEAFLLEKMTNVMTETARKEWMETYRENQVKKKGGQRMEKRYR